MKILVANLGSTSLKWRLFSFADGREQMLHKGGFERVTDYPKAIEDCLAELKLAGHIANESDLAAVGFKTIMARGVNGCVGLNEQVLQAMEAFSGIAPAHNPPYISGIRFFAKRMPKVPLVGLFETAFYQWAPEAAIRYAVPEAWHELGVRRWGFHGASHKFIAERSAEWLDREDVAERARQLYVAGCANEVRQPDLRVISCHLGGSSSITGILNGVAIGTSMGMSPQSGLPQNNRVGDLDSFALPFLMRTTKLSLEDAERLLCKESGLKALSGGHNDIRDVQAQASQGNAAARLALDVFVHHIRHWIGSYFLQLNGADALVFTAGIGENDTAIRKAVCANLDQLGIVLDEEQNAAVKAREAVISSPQSRVKILVIPANEELVVAREVKRLLDKQEVEHASEEAKRKGRKTAKAKVSHAKSKLTAKN
ncbi:MAG TPA: acetate kinase [Patescibacteria group bacterium]|nr:acetate kinase [Patescibacteria group bacterium]